MAHIKYLSEDILDALKKARSAIEASRFLGMSDGALRKRCLKDPFLRVPFVRACERGKKVTRTRTPLNHRKLRRCMYGAFCAVCLQRIKLGEYYYDAGGHKKAHKECGDAEEVKPDLLHSRAETNAAAKAFYRARARKVMGTDG